MLSSGDSHACALTDCGALACWGINDKGQLGIAVSCLYCPPAPVAAPSGLDVVQVAACGSSTCALFSDGSVRCWGDNTYGQLGVGNFTNLSIPNTNAINLGRSAKAIAASPSHACALLDDRSLKCWGRNNAGQLGYGDTTQRTDPDLVSIHLGVGRTAKAISAGSEYTCVLLDDDSVKCWGLNSSGQLGYGDTTQRTAPAVNPINLGTGRSAVSIAAGSNYTCVLLDDDSVKCWGSNSFGQLGYGDTTTRNAPAAQPINLGTGRRAKSIATGGSHVCVILDDDSVKCWGSNNFGQLGYSDTTTRNAPDANPIDLGVGRTAKHIVAGATFTCAFLDDGTVKCWGNNDKTQAEYSVHKTRMLSASSGAAIAQIRCTGTCMSAYEQSRCGTCQTACQSTQACAVGRCTLKPQQMAAGGSFICALFADGARCWGENKGGQHGVGDTTQRTAPQVAAINLGGGRTAKFIATGTEHTCAILDNDSVKCWGLNGSGQLGYGDTMSRSSPLTNSSPINLGAGRTAKSVVAGAYHTCALLDDNTVKCWGNNFLGALGVGGSTNRTAPEATPLNLGRSAKSIAAGYGHTCAILDDGSVKCWGYNDAGQLGYGDTTNRSSPAANVIDLGAGRSAKSIATGYSHTCALLDNDTVKCWGVGGLHGYNDTTQRNAPDLNAIDLGVGRTAASMVVGYHHSCALLDNGTVKCWGRNTEGQLGLGDSTNRSAPTANVINLGVGRTAKSLTAGSYFTCALLDNDAIKCWGSNNAGQLGYGDSGYGSAQRKAPSLFPILLP